MSGAGGGRHGVGQALPQAAWAVCAAAVAIPSLTTPSCPLLPPLPALSSCLPPSRRVVLDEAQLVANSSSVAAVMASSLWRRHAWVVTGTPIASKLDEIKGMLAGGS